MSILPDHGAVRAALGLGGNVGDPVHAMAAALTTFDGRADCHVESVSRLYRTPPWGKTDQSFFYNCCALVETTMAPRTFLDLCLDIEQQMKRVRVERWGPRTLDIDILTFGELVCDEPRLQLPHPRMTERGFVLLPLADIAADLALGEKSVSEWLADVDVEGIEVADTDPSWWRRA